ncbi:MAG: hypothetical protein ABEN55_10880 [Bradymonadaceae bacterium]
MLQQPNHDAIVERHIDDYLKSNGLFPPDPSDSKQAVKQSSESENYLVQFRNSLRSQLSLFINQGHIDNYTSGTKQGQEVWISSDTHQSFVSANASSPDLPPESALQDMGWSNASVDTKKAYENDPNAPYQTQRKGLKELIGPILEVGLGRRGQITSQSEANGLSRAPDPSSGPFKEATLHDIYEVDASNESINITLPKSDSVLPRVITFVRIDGSSESVTLESPSGSTLATLDAQGERYQAIAGQSSWW